MSGAADLLRCEARATRYVGMYRNLVHIEMRDRQPDKAHRWHTYARANIRSLREMRSTIRELGL